MRVLLFSQALDQDDWLRAFMVRWARELATRVDWLHVITQELGRAELPANVTVHSLGRERGHSRARMVLELWRLLPRLLPRVDCVFAHMNPLLVTLAAPWLLLLRKRTVLWYCHPSITATLRVARLVAWRVVCSVPECFPLPTSKLRPIGQGIDFDQFQPRAPEQPEPPDCLLYVARLGRIKHQATVLAALARGVPAQAIFVGGVPPGGEGYAAELQARVEALGLRERVRFVGGVPHEDLPMWYHQGTVAVNLSVPGTFDKTVLEAHAAGLPVVTCNHAFADLLGADRELLLLPDADDVAGLATRLQRLFAMPPAERRALGLRLRAATRRAYAIEHQMDRLVSVLRTGEPGPS